MTAKLYHLQLNVSDVKTSFPFYKKLFKFLGYEIFSDAPDHIAARGGGVDFWIMETEKRYLGNGYNRKNIGLNHIAFRVGSKEAVDEFHREFLNQNSILSLYNTPRAFPEYTDDYYAVFFEDPDRIKLEVVYLSE